MSELNNIRPIPSRLFTPSFVSGQKNVAPISNAWVPKFSFRDAAIDVTFGAGVVNGFLPTNWNDKFSIPMSSERYVKLEVGATINGLNSVKLLVENTPTTINEFRKDYPPIKFKFILGILKGKNYAMTFNAPITVTPIEAFREPIKEPKPGEQPFSRYWHWSIS
jgi:hypothetical protein